ncbi:MAG: universal stress protein UspA [Pseudomonadota bacterium]
MHQCRTILAATDLSPRANRAARRGAQLAHTHGSALHLALVLREAGDRDLPAPLALESIRDQGEGGCADGPHALLNELASVLQRHYGVEVVRHVLYGRPREALISAASEVSADLMIVGAHGAGFFREFLLGSTAFHLVYRCRQPVLVVKNDVFGPYESVLVGVDLSPDSGRALSAAVTLAPRAECAAMYAVCLPYESRWALRDRCDDVWKQYQRKAMDVARAELIAFLATRAPDARIQPRVEYGDPAKLLLERTWQGHADLVVVAKHGRGRLNDLDLGSVSRRIVEAAECDVLLAGADA